MSGRTSLVFPARCPTSLLAAALALCAKLLKGWFCSTAPPAIPPAPCRGRADAVAGPVTALALCSEGGWERRVAAVSGVGGGGMNDYPASAQLHQP